MLWALLAVVELSATIRNTIWGNNLPAQLRKQNYKSVGIEKNASFSMNLGFWANVEGVGRASPKMRGKCCHIRPRNHVSSG